jgi:hypothetical protein
MVDADPREKGPTNGYFDEDADRNDREDGGDLPREWCVEGGRYAEHDRTDR